MELALNGRFDLRDGDADVLIQVSGGSLLWQKERLLNVALSALPPECDTVAWVDCDLVFLRDDWPRALQRQLEHSALVQLFRDFHYLPVSADAAARSARAPGLSRQSLAYLVSRGRVPANVFLTRGASVKWGYVPGGAWGARRSTLDATGFYDPDILGYGDKLLVSAAYGRHRDAMRAVCMNTRQSEHYERWARQFCALVAGRVGHIDGEVLHLWHGELDRRQYSTRFDGFSRFDFDPENDIARTDDGAWRWNSDKPELQHFVRRYFELRGDGDQHRTAVQIPT